MTSTADASLLPAILDEIEGAGPIPFSRFMELALYHPQAGYYTRGLGGGNGRDYVTSSGLHRAYGALIARQAAEMWSLAGAPDRFEFVEFGPGEGFFAADFLAAAAAQPPFARALSYVLVETSPALRGRQQARLERLRPGGGVSAIPVAWSSLEELEARGVGCGCLFANEVLDALPVHRVVGAPGGPREVHVAIAPGGGLREVLLPLSTDAIGAFLNEGGIRPAPGQEVDISLDAPRTVGRWGRLLRRGWLLIVDYGHPAPDLYHPARRRGTLLAYHRHRAGEDFLARPGEQDLTAHVDFSAISAAAVESGLRFAGDTGQAEFLLALGALEFFEKADLKEREALKDLILPDRMGGVFRVMVFDRGGLPAGLRGLSAPWRAAAARTGE
ncbi:MAG TPA: SAM-dependent methyltransferase [Patescibacteria group bacterium]|nr:SAM-dependent methyltransferase [Patescibacteria group bacterium]